VRKVDDHIDFYRTAFNGKTCLKGFDFSSVRT
jgi:hypothetical protein